MMSAIRPCVILGTALVLCTPPGLAAQATTGGIAAHFSATPNALEHRPVMVSVLKDGAVAHQSETVLKNEEVFIHIEPGLYDVRVEGDGLVTEVKRGVQVFAGRELVLQFVMRVGPGVHIVEFARGGLAREEVAARLARLDSLVAVLQARH